MLASYRLIGGLCRPRQRVYNTCTSDGYVRSDNIKPVLNWNRSDAVRLYGDLTGFMTRADAVAESLLESGIMAMTIWSFDPAAIENDGLSISPAQLKAALAPPDCIGPIGFIACIHDSFSQANTLLQESVRAFYARWYNGLVTTMPVIKDGYVLSMERPGLGTDLLPGVFERSDLTVRRSET